MKRFSLRALLAGAAALAIVSALLPAHEARAVEAASANCSVPPYQTVNGKGYKFDQIAGGTIALTGTATSGTVNFGFEADVVGLSVEAPNTGNGAWFRAGTTIAETAAAALADKSGMTIVATSVANFITGAGATKGSAFPIVTDSVSTTGTAGPEINNLSVKCVFLPWKTRGVAAVHGRNTLGAQGVTENVTVHVMGFGMSGNE